MISAVFLNIIDQWSDRLKRSFKFTYFQSHREPENFNEAILNSEWRKDFVKTVNLLAKAFMDFEGPDFEPERSSLYSPMIVCFSGKATTPSMWRWPR